MLHGKQFFFFFFFNNCRLREKPRAAKHLACLPSINYAVTVISPWFTSCCISNTDLPDTLSLPVSIVNRSQEVFELLSIGSSLSSCLCSSMWRGSTGQHHLWVLPYQQCPVCLVRLTWIVFVIGGRWTYSCCFVGCCFQDLFNTACSILV